MTKTTFKIDGLSCPSCIRDLRRAVESRGVLKVDVQLDDGLVFVEHDTGITANQLIDRFATAGYEASLA